MTDRNSGSRTDGRKADGTFAPGNPGKPKGSRHKATQATMQLIDGEAEAITRKAVDLALDGDVTALRLCLERIAPPRKDAPVSFELPEIETMADAAIAAKAIIKAVAEGELSPLEAASVMSLVEQFRRTMETTELEQRIMKLEGNAK